MFNHTRRLIWVLNLTVTALALSLNSGQAQVANGIGGTAGFGSATPGGAGGNPLGAAQPGIRYVTYPASKAVVQTVARDFFVLGGVRLNQVAVARPTPVGPRNPSTGLVRRPPINSRSLARALASSTPRPRGPLR